MHFFINYGLFLAKAFTVVIAILLIAAGLVAIFSKGKMHKQEKSLRVEKLNQQFENVQKRMHEALLARKAYKAWEKQQQAQHKLQEKNAARPRVFVLQFAGDLQASAVAHLREEITAILSIATPQDEVVVCLESAGGMVHSYGLAASQLQRLRGRQIPLTVIIDKIAASGGYLMACVGDKILAAPFAIIGSIGVIAQLPNFHRWLQKHHIDFEQVTAGNYKRTLTVFGENTPEKREKLQQELEIIHQDFKTFIHRHRPQVDLEQVATGEHWLASQALALQLVDGLSTSDDYLYHASQQKEVFTVCYQGKRTFKDKMADWLARATNRNSLI